MKNETDQTQKQTAKIIAFKAPRIDYQLICPDCEGDAWSVQLSDMVTDTVTKSNATLICTCGFYVTGDLIMGNEE
jgi:hypothetical protein